MGVVHVLDRRVHRTSRRTARTTTGCRRATASCFGPRTTASSAFGACRARTTGTAGPRAGPSAAARPPALVRCRPAERAYEFRIVALLVVMEHVIGSVTVTHPEIQVRRDGKVRRTVIQPRSAAWSRRPGSFLVDG